MDYACGEAFPTRLRRDIHVRAAKVERRPARPRLAAAYIQVDADALSPYEAGVAAGASRMVTRGDQAPNPETRTIISARLFQHSPSTRRLACAKGFLAPYLVSFPCCLLVSLQHPTNKVNLVLLKISLSAPSSFLGKLHAPRGNHPFSKSAKYRVFCGYRNPT